MNRAFSQYLDLIRFSGAFLVLLSHFAYSRFTDGRYLWIREINLGSDAVVLFFVLSGLVIAFVASRKDTDLGTFAFNRITRLMSVAVPALLLGFTVDRAGAALFPHFYASPFYNPLPFIEQLARGMSFSNEWAGMQSRLGSNGPFWSLGYEATYYALFAIAWYLRGARRAVLLLLGGFLAGPNILLLGPAWLMGVWVWKRIEDDRLPSGKALVLYVFGPFFTYILAQLWGVPDMLHSITLTHLSPDFTASLRFSDEFIWNNMLAVGFAVHLLGVASLLGNRQEVHRFRAVSWLAGGSFSLYVVHYPLLQFLGPALVETGILILDDILLLSLVLLICYVFAACFERNLTAQRNWLKSAFTQMKKAPST